MRTFVAVVMSAILLFTTGCGDDVSDAPASGQGGSPPAQPTATISARVSPTLAPSPTAPPVDTATPLPAPTQTAGPTPTTPSASWGNDELYVIELDTLAETRLTDNRPFDGQPAWSPDNTQIVFTSAAELYGPNALYVIDASGGDPIPLASDDYPRYAPAWSPDGARIAFIADGLSGAELWIANTDGTDARPLVLPSTESGELPWMHGDPSWSPDGTMLTFAARSPSHPTDHIWTINVDGTNLRQLTTTNDYDLWPVWSPDGTSIAFTRIVESTGETQLYIMNADGTDQRPLLDDNTQGRDAVWSPDGSRLAYVRGVENATDIYILDLATGEKHQITTSERGEYEPAWSPDGTRIAFRTNRDGGHPINCSWEVMADMQWFEDIADIIGFAEIAVVVTTGEQQSSVFGPVEDDHRGQSLRIYTDTVVEVEQVIFGDLSAAGTLNVRQEGGTIGDCVQTVSPTAEFATGERYILFLYTDTLSGLPNGWFPVAAGQSVLPITAAGSVSAPQYTEIDGLPLAEVIEIIRSHAE